MRWPKPGGVQRRSRGCARSPRAPAYPRVPRSASAGAGAMRDLQAPLPDDHRHLLQLEERRIVCSCEACWALHSGDAAYRPVGTRTVWLEQFELDDQLWASFQIPIALAFFMRSTVTGGVVAFYPSPAGATESELSLDSWEELVRRNRVLERLDPDAEALIVNRLDDPPQFVIAPIDQCYALVGADQDALGGDLGRRRRYAMRCPSSSPRSRQRPTSHRSCARLRERTHEPPDRTDAARGARSTARVRDHRRRPPRVRSGSHDGLLGARYGSVRARDPVAVALGPGDDRPR